MASRKEPWIVDGKLRLLPVSPDLQRVQMGIPLAIEK